MMCSFMLTCNPTYQLSNKTTIFCHWRKAVPILQLPGKYTDKYFKGADNTARSKIKMTESKEPFCFSFGCSNLRWATHSVSLVPSSHAAFRCMLGESLGTGRSFFYNAHFEAYTRSTSSFHCCRLSNMLTRSCTVWRKGEVEGRAQTTITCLTSKNLQCWEWYSSHWWVLQTLQRQLRPWQGCLWSVLVH